MPIGIRNTDVTFVELANGTVALAVRAAMTGVGRGGKVGGMRWDGMGVVLLNLCAYYVQCCPQLYSIRSPLWCEGRGLH